MGIYRFYQNGELVGECKNLVTTAGQNRIFRYLAQIDAGYAKAIGLGIGTTTPNVADAALAFEITRIDITQSGPDFQNGTVVFKATIPRELVMQIREASIWSEALTSNPDGVVGFTSDEEWSVGTFQSANTRFGGESLRLTATTGNTTSSVLVDRSLDLAEMNGLQPFKLAVFVGDNNCSNITVRLRNDASNYFQFSQASPTSGYNIYSFLKKNATTTGSPDWSSINEIYVSVTASGGTTNVDFDALRSERQDLIEPSGSQLISRAVLSSPVQKTDEAEMEIEYSLEVNIS